MDPNLLFLRRVSQLSVLVESNEEVELVDIASILRQLLFDKRCLVDAINDGPPLEFEVGIFRPGWGPDSDPHWQFVEYQALQDGIDPQTSVSGLSVKLTRAQFGQHVIAFSRGEQITVKELVKYNANKKGGQHWDPDPVPSDSKLHALERIYVGNIVASTRELKAIGRVVLRTLDPLVQRLQARGA